MLAVFCFRVLEPSQRQIQLKCVLSGSTAVSLCRGRFSDSRMTLCSLLQEEEALVEQFAFEALVTYMESLALAHTDERLGRSIRLSVHAGLHSSPACPRRMGPRATLL